MRSRVLAEHFKGRGPIVNIVLDGWGIGQGDEGDAIHQARKPHIDRMLENCPHGSILTHGTYVGLPAANDIGGSEVGHLTMGAGRIFPQGPTRIKELIDSGEFFEGEVLNRLVQQAESYELLAGQDLKRDPALTARLLARILPTPALAAAQPAITA